MHMELTQLLCLAVFYCFVFMQLSICDSVDTSSQMLGGGVGK